MFCFRRQRRDEGSYNGEYELLDAPIQNANHVPLRLSPVERKIQRLMRGVILASCYTDKVDSESALKRNRELIIVRELTNALTGLIVGLDVSKAAKLLQDKEFTDYEKEICMAVETCRRYKIMNPDMLRTDYVKFLYMVQDAVQNENARAALGFSVASDLVTVGRYCEEIEAEEILKEQKLPLCITPVPVLPDRTVLNKCLRHKDFQVDQLVAQYARTCALPPDRVEIIIRSLNDANLFSTDNVKSTEKLLEMLKMYFHPNNCTPETNLSIEEGQFGSRLTHSHKRQYTYVLQSLSLWKNICAQMYALWTIAEEDMLNPNVKYALRMTGQGLQRVQKAPNLYRAIEVVLRETKLELGEWVGSERIHLGDDQVPNAFHFIDKYGQVSRIILPILLTLEAVDRIEKDRHHREYLREVWGGAQQAKTAVLQDFFRHGFDGSGGDNMDDAGSCIDGRLTSAWNWCSNIRTKPFYPLFLIAGFSSFDGDLST